MAASAAILQNFDKGLRSSWTPEQLTTIAKLPKIIECYPVPTFVNAMLVRVAESFKEGPNEIRVAIGRSLAQCGDELSLVFSSAEIFRRILVVSHANDPDAREAVLDVLACLAPILPESSQAHHLICESLSTEHDGEFRAACSAMKSFAKLSSSFSESIILRIGKVLEDSNCSTERKCQICDVFSTLKANARSMEQIYGISEAVIKKAVSNELLAAFLHATTSLAIDLRYARERQLAILIDMLEPIPAGITRATTERMLVIFGELRRLARCSGIWSLEQVEKAIGCLDSNMPNKLAAAVLDVAAGLAQSGIFLAEFKGLIVDKTAFGALPDPEVFVRYIEVAVKVVSQETMGNEEAEQDSPLQSLSLAIGAAILHPGIEKRLANRLYKSIGDFLTNYPVHFNVVKYVIGTIFADIEAEQDGNKEQQLEMLCRMVDTVKDYVENINRWAISVFLRKRELFNAYPTQFGYLCLAVGTKLPGDITPVMFESEVAKYSTARSAFRNGQWKSVALPNLKAIDLMKVNKATADWIYALRELAQCEISDTKLVTLSKQQKRLRSALSILKVSRHASQFGGILQFPIEFIECLEKDSLAFSAVKLVVKPFLNELSAAITLGDFFNSITANRMVFALSTVEKAIMDAQSAWSALSRTSFCADDISLNLITLYHAKMAAILTALRIILGIEHVDSLKLIIPHFPERTTTLLLEEKLIWAVQQFKNLKFDDVPNLLTIQTFDLIVEELATSPIMLPRFFFQQFYNVDIKVTSTPQSEKNRPIFVQPTETLPIRIDGSVHSTHPSHIRSIVVYAEFNFSANPARNFVLTEVVELNEKNHFAVQFLQSFKLSCDIKFRVEFIDANQRKQWKTTSFTVLSISVRDPQKKKPTQSQSPNIASE